VSLFLRLKHNAGRFCIVLICDKCYNSKFDIFELLVWIETFADALLTGIVS